MVWDRQGNFNASELILMRPCDIKIDQIFVKSHNSQALYYL